jgi:hypothetical protein
MNKLARNFLIFIVLISLIPTSTRFFYYQYKFSSAGNFLGSPISDLKEVDNFPSSAALQILSKDPTARVFTFRQADLLSLDRRNWIDNFDPRAKDYLLAKTEGDLYDLLLSSKVKYVLVPNYSWPTVYNSKFGELLANPAFTTPLIPTVAVNSKADRYQLFKIDRTELSSSCSEFVVKDLTFVKKSGGIPSRFVEALLGIPTGFSNSFEEVNLSELSEVKSIGLNKSRLLRVLLGNPYWYTETVSKLKSSRYIIEVETNSDSLLSLWIQGISKREDTRNLLEVGRLVNVAESRSNSNLVSLNAQVLLASNVGSLRIYLSSFSGPTKIVEPVNLRVCSVNENFPPNEKELQKISPKGSQAPEKLILNLAKCASNGECTTSIHSDTFLRRINSTIRDFIQDVYISIQKLLFFDKDLQQRFDGVFNFKKDDLSPHLVRCISICPKTGMTSLEWTNRFGFRVNLDLGTSQEIDGKFVQVFIPILSNVSKPQIVLRNYSGPPTGKATYEVWREDVKK